VDEITSALREPDRKPIVVVVGLGGIGKTALARETVERCWKENVFDYIVWTSAKTEHFINEMTIPSSSSAYNLDTLLADIGRQCDREDILQMPVDQKLAAIKYLMQKARVLVVMDNLETVPKGDELAHELLQILGRGKVLITSRHRIKHERAFTINLGGLREDESVLFVREESRERGIAAVARADWASLIDIHHNTGGAPLAIKLVLGQMARQPMDVVLATLRNAESKGQDYLFYRFVYRYSWDMLDIDARTALVDMSIFPPITGGAVRDVQNLSQMEQATFWPAMDQLVTMSLVDKIGVIGKERFALHPLTQYFVRSDITKEWQGR
jgi:hypothetical protein